MYEKCSKMYVCILRDMREWTCACVRVRVFYLRRFSPLTHCKALAELLNDVHQILNRSLQLMKLRFYVYIKEYHFPMQQNEWTARKRKRD